MLTRATIRKRLWEGINAFFGLNYREWPAEYTRVFEEKRSRKASEEQVLMGGLGVAQTKGEGAAVAYDTADEGWTKLYKHVTTALAVAITEEAIEDNLYGALPSLYGKALARAIRESCEIRAAAILNNATATGVWAGGDGVALLSASHPRLDGGTFANTFATPADLSETALEDVFVMIDHAKDERGLPVRLQDKQLIIPPALQFDAQRILGSDRRVGTGDNDTNALKDLGRLPSGVAIMRRITDPDAWFVQTDADQGLQCFVRRPTRRKMEGDFETGNLRYKVDRRDSFGFTDPRCLYGSMGAG
jgi:hypothetical protein